ncbi:MAG: DUF2065 domain-containing protein [Bradyrhizobiaceae bacterium]|nr:DUF2065 domain-containing protein [Bradyrhizobiaceae bacterium]
MTDFVVAIGLVLVIEGVMFAAFPGIARRAMAAMMETPEASLRTSGVVAAVAGLLIVWLVRG